MNDDDLDDIVINALGRSHRGGHAYGDKNGSMLPSIVNHQNNRGSNSYPSVANKVYGAHGAGETLSRSPSAGLSGRVDWKSKYLK